MTLFLSAVIAFGLSQLYFSILESKAKKEEDDLKEVENENTDVPRLSNITSFQNHPPESNNHLIMPP